jgi:hypothetical protein
MADQKNADIKEKIQSILDHYDEHRYTPECKKMVQEMLDEGGEDTYGPWWLDDVYDHFDEVDNWKKEPDE